MTQLRDIESISKWLGDSPLADSHMWNKDIEEITPVDVLAFLKLHDMDERGCSVAASRCVDVMLIELRKLIASERVRALQIEKFQRADMRFMLSDLREMLSTINPSFAKVIRFALAAGMELCDAEHLTWKAVSKLRCNPEMEVLLSESPQNIKSPYVFWEYIDGNAEQIIGAELGVLEATGADFSWLQHHYRNMVWIDPVSASATMKRSCADIWGIGV